MGESRCRAKKALVTFHSAREVADALVRSIPLASTEIDARAFSRAAAAIERVLNSGGQAWNAIDDGARLSKMRKLIADGDAISVRDAADLVMRAEGVLTGRSLRKSVERLRAKYRREHATLGKLVALPTLANQLSSQIDEAT